MYVVFEVDERWGVRGVYIPPCSGRLTLVAHYFDAFYFNASYHFIVRSGVDFGCDKVSEFRRFAEGVHDGRVYRLLSFVVIAAGGVRYGGEEAGYRLVERHG